MADLIDDAFDHFAVFGALLGRLWFKFGVDFAWSYHVLGM